MISNRKRIAFVGQSNYFDLVALSSPTRSIEPSFIGFRSGDDAGVLRNELQQCDADVVIVFRPEIVPPGTLEGLDIVRVGWFTEPIARSGTQPMMIMSESQRDLERRLAEVSACDARQFDRLISHDPHLVPTLERIGPIWRSVPLPVDDRFFRDFTPLRRQQRLGFIGRSTPYREEFLSPLKHEHDLVHYAHGLFGDHLLAELGRIDIAINVHNLDVPNFENRVPLHLAQGHLVLSQPLAPLHGLEPERDFIEFHSPEQLQLVIKEIRNHPTSHELIRRRGRLKAEYFRASRVFDKIIRELEFERLL